MATEQTPLQYERVTGPGAGTASRGRPYLERLPALELGLGLALGIASLVVYQVSGYSRGMLLIWLAAVLVLASHFWSRSRKLPRVNSSDLLTAGALMLLFAPLYLLFLYRWPVQVSSDEAVVMGIAERYGTRVGVDLFGVSDHLGRPALLFVPWGNLGELIGGVDLFHMRLLHALFGLFVIAVSYALFRQLLPQRWAIFASCLVGFSHSFFMISRLAMRENTAVLVEVAAFALLLRGLRHDHAFSTYCGGFVAGLGFYVYQPSRSTFPIWVLFLVGLGLLYRSTFPLKKLLRLGLVATAGFVLMAGPIIIAEGKIPAAAVNSQKETLMIYKQARERQAEWVFATSEAAGFATNINFGLTTFNNHVVDHGWIYVNCGSGAESCIAKGGHGFVDPLTGILLWVGVAVVGIGILRRKRGSDPLPLLMLGSFLALWLSFAFLINKAPNYTRLLVTLPFVAYLVTQAVRFLGRHLESRLARWDRSRASRAVAALAAGTLVAVAVGNIAIAKDYVEQGRKTGNDIGSTGRWIGSHPNRNFYLAADDVTYKYFVWGNDAGNWQGRMKWFGGEDRLQPVITPSLVNSFQGTPPFGIFMSNALWSQAAFDLIKRYPDNETRNVTPDGSLLVFQVPPDD